MHSKHKTPSCHSADNKQTHNFTNAGIMKIAGGWKSKLGKVTKMGVIGIRNGF